VIIWPILRMACGDKSIYWLYLHVCNFSDLVNRFTRGDASRLFSMLNRFTRPCKVKRFILPAMLSILESGIIYRLGSHRRVIRKIPFSILGE
jgi:hypothetical protein